MTNDAINSVSKRKALMLKLMLQDQRPLYYRKSVNLGMKSQKKVVENGQHGTVRQNPEVELNSIMDTIFCLMFP